MFSDDDADRIARAFGLGDGAAFTGTVARGEQGQVVQLETSRGLWAVKSSFRPPELDGEDGAFQAAAAAAGVPAPAVVFAAGGALFTDVAGLPVRVYGWVDVLPADSGLDPGRVGQLMAAIHQVPFRGRRLGITICEDIWNDADFWPQRLYRDDPVEHLARAGADVIVNISASPFTLEKRSLRPRMLAATARRWRLPLVFVNQVGGQDDLIFDGASAAFDATGAVIARGKEMETDLVFADLAANTGDVRPQPDDAERAALDALVLGTRDYARRCGFSQALLGLSGGIDSALVAAIATRALGPRNILGVAMPSRYSSPGSLTDARALADALGVDFEVISIEPMFAAYLTALAPAFQRPVARDLPDAADLAAQNLQARVRGAILACC